MAFRGRRSTACRLCRERRIKCDRQHPGCTQCRNVQAICDGYRTELDLMFQHETDTVIRKAGSHTSKRKLMVEGSSPVRNQIAVRPPTSAPLQQLAHPPSFQAIGLFASAYAHGVYLEYLPVMYMRQTRPASLEKSFEAVALGHMANEQQREDLRELAHRNYGDALSQIKVALQEPKAPPTTETIASILLLALFEAISPTSYHQVQDIWSTHVRGALAVIAQWSTSESFQTPVGQGVLHHIISAVQLDCIYRRVRLPDQLQALYSVSWYKNGPQVDMWLILDRLATLNAESKEGSITFSYLAQLQTLQTDIQSLLVSMPQTYPDSFTFRDITPNYTSVSGPVEYLQIPSHTFQSFRIARAWNTLRLMRLLTATLLTSAINSYLSFHANVTEELAEDLGESRRVASGIANMVAIDICASVPNDLRPGNWSYDPNTRMQYSAWARSLLWPLSMCKQSPHGSKELQSYIKEQLRILSIMTGMQNMQREKPDVGIIANNWMHVTFLC